MIGSLLDHWRYTWPDVWSVLAKSRKAPPDLFIQLYRETGEFLQCPPRYQQLELIVNDPAQATQAFEQIQGQNFKSEASVVRFMESAFETIQDFEIDRYAKLYKRLVTGFVRKYNLRYRVDEPFRLRLHLTGVFAGLYADLGRLNQSDPHLAVLMDDFEKSFGRYARLKQPNDLRTCISRASNYAEGVAAKTHGRPDALGAICDHLECWPHATVRESLKRLYGFCCDYPGIRHAGNPDGQLRDLESKDAILICLLLVSFSGYLTIQVKAEEILGV